MDISLDEETLWKTGFAHLPQLLTSQECEDLCRLYADESRFRSKINMKRYRFGQGEYQYFDHPLPGVVERVRTTLYEQLAPMASKWTEALGMPRDYPPRHTTFLDECHQAGQLRPTPLLLRYRDGDYNCLHQDLYGDIYFPFQVIVCLSEPGCEFSGGELLLVEQHPRAQSTGRVVPLRRQGDAAVITTRYRPVQGSRGYYRANVRHAVSTVTAGERFTLGIIFHDAV